MPPTCRSDQPMRMSNDRDNDLPSRATNGSHGRQWCAVAVEPRRGRARRCDSALPHEAHSGGGNIARTFGLNSRLFELWSGDVRSRCSHVVIRESKRAIIAKGERVGKILGDRSRFELSICFGQEESRSIFPGSQGDFTLFFSFSTTRRGSKTGTGQNRIGLSSLSRQVKSVKASRVTRSRHMPPSGTRSHLPSRA
jgi:hypothetical protein